MAKSGKRNTRGKPGPRFSRREDGKTRIEKRNSSSTQSRNNKESHVSWTLEDYIIFLFENKQTETVEFKALLRIYGRDRIVKIWGEYKNGTKRNEHQKNESQDSEGAEVTKRENEWAKKAGSFVSRSVPNDDF